MTEKSILRYQIKRTAISLYQSSKEYWQSSKVLVPSNRIDQEVSALRELEKKGLVKNIRVE